MKSKRIYNKNYSYGVVSHYAASDTTVLLSLHRNLTSAKRTLISIYDLLLNSKVHNAHLWDGKKKLTYIKQDTVISIEIIPYKRMARLPFFENYKRGLDE